MHSLLDRSVQSGGGGVVWLFQGRFPLHKNFPERCIDKEYIIIWYFFRHVALLVTEILHQDQNLRIIPRIYKIIQHGSFPCPEQKTTSFNLVLYNFSKCSVAF